METHEKRKEEHGNANANSDETFLSRKLKSMDHERAMSGDRHPANENGFLVMADSD